MLMEIVLPAPIPYGGGEGVCGPPTAQSNLCPRKKAQKAARGWRSPLPPPHLREGAAAPSLPASPPPEAATAGEEMEAVMEVEVQAPAQGGVSEREE